MSEHPRHLPDFTDSELNELRLGLDALVTHFMTLHPDVCQGCISEGVLITMLAQLKRAGWELPDILENACKVFDVEVQRMEEPPVLGGGGTPPTVH